MLCCLMTVTAFGQSTSIKSASGNGPILSGLKITNAKAVGNLREMGSQLATPVAGSDGVDVQFSFGRITQYRYNGKTYKSEELNGKCKYYCGDCVNQKVKVTATIKAGGKTYTRSGTLSSVTGLHHFSIKLPGLVKRNTISLVSLTVVGMAYPEFEQQLQQYEQCLKKEKEKEKTAAEKKATTKTDDDFWNGGEKKTEQRKLVGISNNDFWSGKEEKKKEEDKKIENKDDTVNVQNIGYTFTTETIDTYFGDCGRALGESVCFITNVYKVPPGVKAVEIWNLLIEEVYKRIDRSCLLDSQIKKCREHYEKIGEFKPEGDYNSVIKQRENAIKWSESHYKKEYERYKYEYYKIIKLNNFYPYGK